MARATRSSTATALPLVVMVASVGLGMGIACSPEETHRVLTFFFDDVPPLGSASTQAAATRAAAQTQAGKRRAKTRRRRPPKRASLHKPFRENQCVRCHEGRFSMKVIDPVTLCKRCHMGFVKALKFVHGPVAVLYCSICHHPHSSPLPHLLKKPDPVICLECHERDSVLAARYHGPDAEQGCTRCHNPHGGDNRMFLKAVQTRPSTRPSPATRPTGNGKG